jgi:hypothetical protein
MLTVALVVPIAICVIVALGRLLAAMGDVPAAVATLDWVAAALGILWVLDLICLVLALAIESLREPHEPDEPE